MKEGLLVTDFLGGNSNGTTGDFSLGIQGYLVRGGVLAEPVSEMNLSGNHLEFWKAARRHRQRPVSVVDHPDPDARLRGSAGRGDLIRGGRPRPLNARKRKRPPRSRAGGRSRKTRCCKITCRCSEWRCRRR